MAKSIGVPTVRLAVLLAGVLAMLAATIVFAGPARAQSTPLTIPDVEGKVYSKKTGKVKVSGTLVGELTKKANPENPISINEPFKTKMKASVPGPTGSGEVTTQAVCNILTLNIGAIHLDLLGLVVDLSPIDLVIDAVSGPGNLLGNLLCAVAGLLDPSNALANFLNALLEELFGVASG